MLRRMFIDLVRQLLAVSLFFLFQHTKGSSKKIIKKKGILEMTKEMEEMIKRSEERLKYFEKVGAPKIILDFEKAILKSRMSH